MGLLSSVGGLFGSNKEAGGYKNAAQFMKKLGQEAGKAQAYADPFSSYRSGIASTLNDYITGQRDISTDPGYQFTQNEAMNEVSRAAAARGLNTSGNVMAALQQRSADIASQQYSAIIDRLTNLAGASSQNAIAGGQLYGSMMTSSLTGQADAAIGQAAAQGRGIASLYGGLDSLLSGVTSAVTGGGASSISKFFS